jgi:serine/threonine protein kinase
MSELTMDSEGLVTIELQPLKNIGFLTETAFLEKYSFNKDNKIFQGAYGTIYHTNSEFVVKKGELSKILSDIDVLSQIQHPNIIKMLDVSLTSNQNCYIAFPKGGNLDNYINQGIKVNNENNSLKYFPLLVKIMYDLACGLAFLHDVGIVHGDIKHDNVVIINDQPILIDFGLSKICIPVENELIFKGTTYTALYAEPEYIELNYNPISGDIFSLGKLFEYIVNQNSVNSSLPFIFTSEDISDNDQRKLFNDLISKMVTPRKTRITAKDILLHPLFTSMNKSNNNDSCKGIRFTTAIETKDVTFINLKDYYIFIKIILDRVKDSEIHLRTLFLTLHNIHRSFNVLKNYISISSQDHLSNDNFNNLKLFVIVNLYLAFQELEVKIYDLESFVGLDISFNRRIFFNMERDILNYLKGVIYTYTYWDLCKDPKDLSSLLEDTISYDYVMDVKDRNLYSIEEYGNNFSSIKNYPNKIILCKDFVPLWLKLRSINNYDNLIILIKDKEHGFKNNIVINIKDPSENDKTITDKIINTESLKNISSKQILAKINNLLSKGINKLYLLGYIHGLKPEMEKDTKLANKMLNIVMSIPSPNLYTFDIVYDIRDKNINGKNKLTMLKLDNKFKNHDNSKSSLNIEDLNVNMYTISNEDLQQLLAE